MASPTGAELQNDLEEIVRFSVPGTLLYRDVVLRVVASVCRLVRNGPGATQETSHRNRAEDFDEKVVSAVGEAFNNVAQHAYRTVRGEAKLELGFAKGRLTIRLLDTGEGFDLARELGQDLETLRESRMGLEIMLACMDEVTYVRGGPTTPNVLTMTKRYLANAGASRSGNRVALGRA
jgi:anti-sigma regulatory factor (Ser/Thr protein kinase)